MASIGKEVTKTMKVKNAAQKFKTYKRKRTEDLAANKNSEPDLLQRSTKHAQKVPQVACLQTEISFCDSHGLDRETAKKYLEKIFSDFDVNLNRPSFYTP